MSSRPAFCVSAGFQATACVVVVALVCGVLAQGFVQLLMYIVHGTADL